MTKCNSKNSCMGYYGKCLDIKITNACNANCSFCIEKGGYNPNTADITNLIRATNTMKNYTNVLVLGGEPLLCKDLELYLAGIRPQKEKIYLTTNGSRLNTEMAEMLSQYLDGINISIHHYFDKKNNEIYGIGINFDNIKKAIMVFRENEVPVRINCNLIKGYIDNSEKAKVMMEFVHDVLMANELRFCELQEAEDVCVDARELFPGLTDNPFCDGCEQSIESPYQDMNITVKMTCGCVNKTKEPVADPEPAVHKTKVIYPNGEVSDGWKKKLRDIHESSRGCHDLRGCH
ncbi:MAG: hypothetical protein DBX58_06345 [Clostridiales bacterium]|nr:MAG: hypothetical protein DBX58_06345 [Clostridiales bacterium]